MKRIMLLSSFLGMLSLQVLAQEKTVGRLTLVIEDEAVAAFFLKNNDQAVAKAGCLSGEPIYFGISPTLGDQGRAMAAKFDAGIKAMRASGELKVILDKYGLADWKQ